MTDEQGIAESEKEAVEGLPSQVGTVTPMPSDPSKVGRQPDGRFAPGNNANPTGRPLGSKHKATVAVEALLQGEAEGLTRKAVELALGGDVTALRLCLERIAPPMKSRSLQLALPPIAQAGDIVGALGTVIGALVAGDLTVDEAAAVVGILDAKRRSIETADLEARLTTLEQQRSKRHGK